MHRSFSMNVAARSLRFRISTPTIALLLACGATQADNAVSVPPSGLAIAFNNIDASQGWQFTVDVPIEVTALGLLDSDDDGFASPHPIAIWDEEGTMLMTATVQAGTVNPLIGQFRYASVEEGFGNALTPGQTYTIGYFLEAFSNDAYVLHDVHTMHPLINQIGASVFTPSSELTMPSGASSTQCFGPSFQFNVVPGPSGLFALLLAVTAPMRRRRS